MVVGTAGFIELKISFSTNILEKGDRKSVV